MWNGCRGGGWQLHPNFWGVHSYVFYPHVSENAAWPLPKYFEVPPGRSFYTNPLYHNPAILSTT